MKSTEIAKFLKKEHIGENVEITTFSSLSNLVENSVVFAKKYNKDYSETLSNAKNVLAIVCEEYRDKVSVPHIISNNPRLDYLRVVSKFFVEKEIPTGIHPTAVVEEGVTIGKNVSIGAHCYIASRVSIGDNTIVLPNTSIYSKVTIGTNCYIKPGVVIGGPGFGFEYDENGVPVHFPHTGDVIIGDNVSIGSNTCIDRGTIDSTIIEDNVKLDNLVHIGHNVHIHKNSLIVAGTIICGGVNIGENCWISPNSSLHQKITIGNHAKVGIGSVVIGRVREGQTVFGVPAKRI